MVLRRIPRTVPSRLRRQALAAGLALLALLAGSAGATTFTVDAAHSSVVFKAKHLGASNFYGAFDTVTGSIVFDENNPATASVTLEIPTAGINSRNENRDNHLKSPDFFNAAQFPAIKFTSTNVSKTGANTYRVTGDLDLHGVTKSITAEVEHTGSGKHPRSGKALVGFEARFTINRSDFGMNYMVGPLSDEIGLIIAVEAVE